MSIEAVLVWGGLTVAILDSTGYGEEINALLDRIVRQTAEHLKNRHSPLSQWFRTFDFWLIVEERVHAHRSGRNPLPKEYMQLPFFKDKTTPFRYLRWRKQRSLAFKRVLDRVLFELVLFVFVVFAMSIAAAIWAPLWFLLTELGMPTGQAVVNTFVIAAFFSLMTSNSLYGMSRRVAAPVIGGIFAVSILLLSGPLAIFRIFPTGYLSVFGLLFAALGAYQYASA